MTDTVADDHRITAMLPRAALVVVAALLYRLGFRLWGLAAPGDVITAVVMVYIYGTATALILLAVVGIDLDRWGRLLMGWVLVTLGAGMVWFFLARNQGIPTDTLLFSRTSADLALEGANPYTANMWAASERFSDSLTYPTPTVSGGYVRAFSYPAGTTWLFVPAVLVGSSGAVTMGAVALAAGAVLVTVSPGELAPVAMVAYLTARNLPFSSATGLTDALWLLPAAVALVLWYADRRVVGTVVLGVACSMKPQPWFVIPFLGLWVVLEGDSLVAGVRRAAALLALGTATVLAINLPFVLADPGAWFGAMFTQVGSRGTLVQQGSGIVFLSVSGALELPKGYFMGLLFAAFLAAVVGYWTLLRDRDPASVGWVAWVMPPALLFFSYRSLSSYFTFFVPVAYLALLAATDTLRVPAVIRRA